MFKLHHFHAVLFVIFGLTSAQAATIVVANGELIGFDGIAVGTETYDVRFVEGSFNSIFGDETGLTFTESVDAHDAANALKDAFDTVPEFDDNPEKTYGVTSTDRGYIWTPYRADSNVAARVFQNYFDDEFDVILQLGMSRTANSTDSSTIVFADWQQVSIVPVPAAVWLFGSALGLLGWMRRSRSTFFLSSGDRA
jgi:hypothetical protein